MAPVATHAIGGFEGTIIMTIFLAASRALGWTRMDMPFLLGTLFTADRDRARWLGIVAHQLNGWLFTVIYFAAFAQHARLPYPLFGAAIGLVHGLYLLTVGMSVLPSFHPRMRSEQAGPGVKRLLEPPGFLALNYGAGTPLATLAAHLLYGASLGWCYQAMGH